MACGVFIKHVCTQGCDTWWAYFARKWPDEFDNTCRRGEWEGVALTITRLRSLRGLHASANIASRCRTNMEYSIRAANVDDCKDIARMIMVSGRIRGHTEKRVERPSFCVRCDLRLSASHVWAQRPCHRRTDGCVFVRVEGGWTRCFFCVVIREFTRIGSRSLRSVSISPMNQRRGWWRLPVKRKFK